MRARTWLITLAICGALALGAFFALRAPAQGNNVVLVVIDTLRQDHLAAYGYNRDTAPFLSGLARHGAVLDGLSPTSWTKPAVASLLTGLHPVRHQTFNRQDKLPGEAVTRGQDKLVLGKNPYRKELFDLARDPAERRSLLGGRAVAAPFPRLAEEISKRYNEYARVGLAPKLVDSNQVLMKKLAALGYVSYRGSSDPSRAIPSRITPPGPTPGGRLGWEAGSQLGSCIELGQPSAARHLLDGWYTSELAGRWTALRGTLALALPSAAPRFDVTLSGVNHRPAPVGLRVKVDHRPVLETQVAVGPFDLAAKVQGAISKLPVLVEIESDSVFVPSLHGGNDWRELGMFVSSVCLE